MKVKNILLTGDDGYNSVGTRVLIHYLKKKYKLAIAATRLQQSGVGGRISLSHDINWNNIEVDGIKGFYVDGTPSDAIEVARSYYSHIKFDIVLSGINLGANIGGTFSASGTFAAAERSLLLQLAKKAIALSLHVTDHSHYLRQHDGIEDIKSYLAYPGKTVFRIVEAAILNNFWDSDLINVNLPSIPTNKVRFTRPLSDITTFYEYPYFDKKNKRFRYPFDIRKNSHSIESDAGALLKGYISITTCKSDSVNEHAYQTLKNKTFILSRL